MQTLSPPSDGPVARSADPGALAEWCRIAVATASRSALTLLCGAVLWAVLPVLIGWQPTTVLTGSMEPRIRPGDVVVARPLEGNPVRVGQVLLFDDPDRPGRLRLHRAVRVDAAHLVTKGDANEDPDSSPVRRAAVHGVGVLRLPYVGLPVLWVREGRWAAVAATAAAVAGLLVLATVDEPIRRRGAERPRGPRPPAGRSGRRLVAGALAVPLLVAGSSQLTAGPASAAPFRAMTSTAAGFNAAVPQAPTGLTCANGANGTVVISWAYSGDVPASFELLSGGAVLTSVPGTARSLTYASASGSVLQIGTQYALKVRTTLAGSWSATSASAVPINALVLLGLSAVQCA